MRIGIITDIHANTPALKSVLADIDEVGVDYIGCLGDVVGYGGSPDRCCDLVRERADAVVMGHHDAAVTGQMEYDYYRKTAREALDVHRRELSSTNFEWLSALPMEYCTDDVRFCHGVPPNLTAFEYLFNVGQVEPLRIAYEEQAWITFVGHSHLCKAFSYRPNGVVEVLRTRFDLSKDRKYIISAGSVGQPRDYDNRACWGFLDLNTQRFEYRRVTYSIDDAVSAIEEAGIASAFGRRLYLGI